MQSAGMVPLQEAAETYQAVGKLQHREAGSMGKPTAAHHEESAADAGHYCDHAAQLVVLNSAFKSPSALESSE